MSDVVKCPRCGQVIGQVIALDDIKVLQVGGALCRFLHGICSQCGEEIHWSMADIALSRLLKTCIREIPVL